MSIFGDFEVVPLFSFEDCPDRFFLIFCFTFFPEEEFVSILKASDLMHLTFWLITHSGLFLFCSPGCFLEK